jgi:hypothetical protein
MATEQQDTTEKPDAAESSESNDSEAGSGGQLTEKPEVTDEHKEKAKEMAKAYEDDRPTIGLPGTSNTVSGQAVVEWVDEDGSPKFGDVEEGEGIKREDVMGVREKAMGEDDRD